MEIRFNLGAALWLLVGIVLGALAVRLFPDAVRPGGTAAQVVYWLETERDLARHIGPPSRPRVQEVVKVIRDTVRVEVCEQVPPALADTARGRLRAEVGLVRLGSALRLTSRTATLTAWNPSLGAYVVERYSVPERVRMYAMAGYGPAGPVAALTLDWKALGVYIGMDRRGPTLGLRVKVF